MHMRDVTHLHVCCSVLQCIAVCCSVFSSIRVLQCVLQFVAVSVKV